MATVRLGGYAPRESVHGRALDLLAETLRKESDGALTVEVMWNILDSGRPASDLLSMVEEGVLTLCYYSTSYLAGRVPLLELLDIPFLFRDLGHAHRALDGELGARLTEATEAVSAYTVLGYWDNGFRHITNRLRPIRTPADIRGMRIRLQPNAVHAAMVEAWGAIPVPVELREGIELIRSGAVDAQENPLANTAAYGVETVHRHATMSAHLYGARGLYAHRPTLEAMSSELRRVLSSAARRAIEYQRSDAEQGELRLRASLERGGMAFVDLTPDERAAFADAAAGVGEAARRRLGRRVFELAEEVET